MTKAFEEFFAEYYSPQNDHGQFPPPRKEVEAFWNAATERAALIAEADHYGEWLAKAIRGEA